MCNQELGSVPDNVIKCQQCGGKSPGRHPCPYALDVLVDDNPEYCNCCEKCEHECSNNR